MSIAYRPEVDGLRAASIIIVVLFHYIGLRGGFVGVDIFFVISGYLITSIIFEQSSENKFSTVDFYKKRIKRIFPALLAVLFCSYIFGWLYLLSDEFASLGLHITAGAGFFSNLLLLNESGYFDTASELKPLLHLWSLSIEEQFYLLWPAILITLKKLNIPTRPALILIVVISFSANILQMNTSSISSFYLPVTRFWELALGGILYGNLFGNYLNKYVKLNNIISVTGLAMIGISVYLFNKNSNFPGWLALIPTVGAASILASSGNSLINRHILSSRPFIFIGLISYPLYLWHWPILSFIRIVEVNGLHLEQKITAISLSLTLAWLTFRYIEKPVRSNKNHQTYLYLITCMVIFGCIGYLTFYKQGFDFRYPQAELTAKQFQLNSSGDIAQITKTQCSRFNQSTEEKSGSCFISDADKAATVMTIGDSHAIRNTVGMIDFFKGNGENFSIVSAAGCLPFYQVQIFRGENATDYCSGFMAKALDFAAIEPSIKTVILANRGSWYLTGYNYKDNSARQFQIGFTGDKDLKDRSRIFEKGLRITLDRLTKAEKNVILLIDNPELGFLPKSCVKYRPLTFGPQIKVNDSCAEPLNEVKERNLVYRTILEKASRDYPSIKILDAEKYFCDESYCYGKIDGKILYADKDHLSEAGGRYIGDKFISELAAWRKGA